MKTSDWCRLACAAALVCVASARAELPAETLTVASAPPPNGHRLYLADVATNHLLDARTHVVDGESMRYLGMLGTGYFPGFTPSRDGKSLYVATTYMSRLQRGTRTDVVEVYGAEDLALRHEIEIPAKRAQSVPIRGLLGITADDRFLLVQNATPATSVTVVDTVARRSVAEIPTPGCFGVIPWPNRARRFSTVCGDGTLASFDLDEKGALAARLAPEPFFDADKDPVFIHYELTSDRLTFVSYQGRVHVIDLTGDKPLVQAPWPMVDAAETDQNWRPGGFQLFTIEPRGNRLFVGMHRGGKEGSHKKLADEIWVFDLHSRERVARLPGHKALALNVERTDKPRLYLVSGVDSRIFAFDAGLTGADPAAFKPLAVSEPVGEATLYFGLSQ